MHRFFKQNLSYRIISLLIAVSLWMWVTTERNPTQEKVLQVPLETKNLAEEFMIAEKPDSIKIRIEGRTNIIEDITTRDLSATVNLAGATVGTNTSMVEVTLPNGVQLVSTVPAQVKIEIDEVVEVQTSVAVEIEGEVQEGYSSLAPLATPSEVIIKGPKRLLDTIDKVFVTARIEGRSQSLSESLPLKVRDSKGNLIQEWLRQEPGHVEVFIPIIKEEPSQKILVKPAIIGRPATGYRVKRVEVEPEIVEAYGSYQSLSSLDYLTTESIVINNLTSNLIQEVEVITPDESINALPKTVRVIIQLEKDQP